MAGLCRSEIRDFAFDPNVEESALEQVADAVRELANFPHTPLGHQIEKRSLAHVVITGILAPEQIYDPENQREHDAQHDASDDWKIEAAIFALIGDIAGQASKAKRQSPAECKKCAKNNEDDSTKDLGDQAATSYNREFLFELSNGDRRLLKEVGSALQKLEDGNFGDCERCGEAIAEKRLEALPFARYCIECQRAIEEEERTAAG